MLRAVSTIYFESQSLEVFATVRKDAFKLFRTGTYSAAASHAQTVIAVDPQSAPAAPSAPPPSPPPPPPPPPHRRSWTLPAAAVALTASIGGVYFYRKLREEDQIKPELSHNVETEPIPWASPPEPEPVPASGAAFPAHVQYLLVGAGTASFAALRAIRSARPDAGVLLVGDEPAPPYMRPPLSKELWRESDLARRALRSDTLTFRQWNGKRRPLLYEPSAFYAPVERLAEGAGGAAGAALALGWRLTRLDVERHEVELTAPGRAPVTLRYDKCLLATGVRAARVPALADVARAGRSLALRGLRDAARLAAALDDEAVRRVAVVGGGFLATELSAALAERLRAEGKTVVQVCRESAPLAAVLPGYLAADAQRRLTEVGVRLLPGAEVRAATLADGAVRLELHGGGGGHAGEVECDLVVECAGSEPEVGAAAAAGLELHPALGGVVVNAELQARTDVYAAGDVACFHDVSLGRRRLEHHDHAVVSGRLAGENMAAVAPPKTYTHQSMFWSDLGPQLGYEAIGIIDSTLPTVGVFSADAVTAATTVVKEAAAEAGAAADAGEEVGAAPGAGGEAAAVAEASAGAEVEAKADDTTASRRYERGVVFYLRERRVVGVLLWNLFNRMHVARQVLAQGEFEDLFEVAKLFALHEDD